MKIPLCSRVLLQCLLLSVPTVAQTLQNNFTLEKALNRYNVRWEEPGAGPQDSMPLGNGDIGLNLWTEKNGDLVFYISMADAWSENNRSSYALMKLARVRVAVTPAPQTTANFHQELSLLDGSILVTEGNTKFRVWVDANHPVVHVDASAPHTISMRVTMEDWRTEPMPQERISADTILHDRKNRIVWYHHNGERADLPLKDWTFGASIESAGFISRDDHTLESEAPAKAQSFAVYPYADLAPDPVQWVQKQQARATGLSSLNASLCWQQHQEWWSNFWHRSWVYVSGNKDAEDVTRGYILQRFKQAASGRGGFPIKFNGSIFVVDAPWRPVAKNSDVTANADYRGWGGQYWFQNTRPIYWPMLQSGDFDLMQPLFRMYKSEIANNAPLVRQHYGHNGSYFAETAAFYGGIEQIKPDSPGLYTRHYFTPVLELSMMMLDYFDYTGDRAFVTETLLPIAYPGTIFFSEHFGRDKDGKLLLDPDNAIEMYWKVHNPAPDIAALHAVLPRLLALPNDLTTAEQRAFWTKLLGELPELPIGEKDGKQVLLPYTGEQIQPRHNSENPELYAVYPYRLYGIGRDNLTLARNTYDARLNKAPGCWTQDIIQSAQLGLAADAKQRTIFTLTRKDSHLKFPAFWDPGHDYQPDEDNGGNGLNGLQQMLLQINGRNLYLLPAWPKEWDADFKLAAPFQTIVEGSVRNGKLVSVKVTPESRRADLTVLEPQETLQVH
jgi:hypothetical protein